MKKIIILYLVTSINIAFLTTYAQDCDPATITKVEHEGTGNRITWTMPIGRGEVVITQGGNHKGWTGDSEDFAVYHRFTPEELATINSGTLTHIVFAPAYAVNQTEPGHNYTIQIYKGGIWGTVGNRNPGILISSQELSNNNLIFKEENIITLETQITIDASQELWIGYYCTNINSIQTPSKEPAGTDNGPRKVGFGDITFYQNQWQTLHEINSASNYNWCIKGIVQTIDGSTVTIYNNNIQIATNIPGTTYFHPNPTGSEQCYKVKVNCLEGGVSLLSNEVCIKDNSIDEQVNKFNIYPNPANNELRITNYELRDEIIEIYDVYGRKLLSNHLISSSSHHLINISSLSSGVYFIRLSNEQGSSVQRFIKE